MEQEKEVYNITLKWNEDHYDAYVKQLGEGVQATGSTREEALRKANEAIARFVWEVDEMKRQKAS
jgi:predicted RNase H-like HicB family nuclease